MERRNTLRERAGSARLRAGSNRASAHQRSSADIVAVSTEMRQRMEARKQAKKHGKKGDDHHDARRELVMTEHKCSISELCADLMTDIEVGMSAENIDMRRHKEGPNMLTPPKQVPEWVKLIREMTGFFSILLFVGAVACFGCYFLAYDITQLYLAVALIAVILVSGLFSYFQNKKSSNLMESFKNMMPTMITVLRDGKSQKINAVQLVRGDIVLLKGGDKVPADIRVVDCSDDFLVDNSCLTGESEPLKRVPHCTDENPLETKNLCFFGTLIPQGNGKGIVVNIGDSTVMGRIAKLATATGTEMTPIAREINHFVHIITAVAVTTGVIFFIVGFIKKLQFQVNLAFMIGIIVANVPEGLLVTVTVCLSLAAARMSKKNMLVKNLQGVETLGSTTCICSDKTGTLTQNIMTVANVVYDNHIYDAECSITPVPNYNLNDDSFFRLQRCATLCNNAVFDEESKFEQIVSDDGNQLSRGAPLEFKTGDKINWETIGDASESAMIKFVQDKRDIMEYRKACPKIKEIPFNSKNKYQVSIHKIDDDERSNLLLVMKGAPERITARCSSVMINGVEEPLTPQRLAEIEDLQLQLSKRGMRVLGFAEKSLDNARYPHNHEFSTDNPNFPLGEKCVNYDMIPTPYKNVEEPLCFVGLMALIDPPRPEVPGAVEKCKTAGIRVIMVTGDHPVTAKAIAHKVGILWGPTKEDIEESNAAGNMYEDPNSARAIVVPGWTISVDTAEEEWDRILDHPQIVFARTSPQQKLIIVENCQRRKEIVAVTGDGVNDSPALKKADIGVAMGIMGSEVSKEAADMILLDDNFASIVCGVEEGRIIFDNLKKSIAYALAANIPELVPVLLNVVINIPLPLTALLMIAICLGTDMVPAISMAYEGAENDIMLRPPRNAAVDRLVTKKLVTFAYLIMGMIEAFGGMFCYFVVMNSYGYSPKILPGLGGAYYGHQVLWCKTSGGAYCSAGGKALDTPLGNLGVDAQCSSEYNATIPTGGNIYDAHIFWDAKDDGYLVDCQYAVGNFVGGDSKPSGFKKLDPKTYGTYTNKNAVPTFQSMSAAWAADYRPYTPMLARRSSFFKMTFMKWDVHDGDVYGLGDSVTAELMASYQPIGVWAATSSKTDGGLSSSDYVDNFKNMKVSLVSDNGSALAETSAMGNQAYATAKYFNQITTANPCSGEACLLDYTAGFTYTNGEGKTYTNVLSRMMQSEALAIAQTAYFVAIIMGQWGNLLICKTRYLSLFTQGLSNEVMMMGLMFETLLGAVVSYAGFLNTVFSTGHMRLTHWFCGLPFTLLIFGFDEMRKFMLRETSVTITDKDTGRMIRTPGWVERNTYY
ncbi:sodium/potassium-transporting ATPase subunit alpha [Thraustotheca clavata]|uniref:Sodium/potassium-transporting ATPase subunit alpha n=1 Tax=Thraustotheca clavata TaxID=74557 RepID=A0A1V9ZPI0_9STRA|nr:sodium/potassium-transporting ATPase subunit alpha [Thraustotheca clavata]